MSFHDRQLDIIYKKYKNSYNDKPILKLLTLLSEDNRNLIFLGDSLTMQTYQAFQLEAIREDIILEKFTLKDINQINITCINEMRCNEGYGRAGLTLWHRNYNFPKIWIPPKSSGLINSVSILLLWLSDYEIEYNCKCDIYDRRIESNFGCKTNFAMTLQYLLPCVTTKIFLDGSYIVANQGAHMGTIKDSGHYHYSKNTSYKNFFRYLLDLKKTGKDIIVYKENFPVFFSENSGNQEKHIEENETHYMCVPKISWKDAIDDGSKYIFENNIDIDILRTDYFYPFWKQKTSINHIRNVLDCMHHAIIVPTTWFPFFHDMFEIYKNNTMKK